MTCQCVKCPDCGGTGNAWFGIDGKYVGEHHMDDTDSLEPCDMCGGSGITEMCEDCQWAEEEEWRSANFERYL